VTERVVAVQRESAPLLGIGSLKYGITAIGVGAKLVYISEALIEGIRLSNAPVVPLGLVVDLSYE